MKGRQVARPDNMSGDDTAGGPRDSQQAPLLVAPGEDLGDSGEYSAGHGVVAMNGRLRAVKQGRKNTRDGTVSVEPRRTAYACAEKAVNIVTVESMSLEVTVYSRLYEAAEASLREVLLHSPSLVLHNVAPASFLIVNC